MKTNLLLLFAGLFAATALFAQAPSHPQYIKTSGTTEKFYNRYAAWQPGQPYSADPAAKEDEEFFISRVKMRERFNNAATQVNPTQSSARKFLWWCPIGQNGWNAIPSYHFDSEVWNAWSYLDHYGNWTADFIRMPAAFMDICHKNGIGTSVVAAIAFMATVSPTDGGGGQNFQAITNGGGEKLARYLRYYGIDGIGFNSEFIFSSVDFNNSFQKTIGEAFKKGNTDGYWPSMANCWYSITDNDGRMGKNWDALFEGNKNWFHNNGNTISNYFFLNYNWNSTQLNTSVNVAKSFPGRSSYDVYAGLDFQGKGSAPLRTLQAYEISLGIWGAHNMNMPFESRGNDGAVPRVKQNTYLKKLRTVFSGGTHNPLNTIPVSDKYGHGTTMPDFSGFGKFITARSPLKFDLNKEPFITYFNLGNGLCFREKGEITFPGEWYNIGVQDFMPTWQFWFSNKFRGQNAATDLAGTNLKATFTWDDAWFGGSALQITGQTTKEYLQLFKTQIRMTAGDQITVRYKLKSGSGTMFLTTSAENAEEKELAPRNALMKADAASEVWQTATVGVGSNAVSMVNLNGKNMALMGLRFENTSADFEVLIGEVTIKRPLITFPTPIKPTLTLAKTLGANYKGVDFKLTYKMADREKAEDPIYNSDVNTWYFKIWYQQEGQEPVFCVNTTSWAAYVVGAPTVDVKEGTKFRCGVSAVGISGIGAESEIAWSEYLSVTSISVDDKMVIDKPVIKANEKFTVGYEDPNHGPASKWEIRKSLDGTVVKTIDNVRTFTTELPEVGIYDLYVTTSSGTTKLRAYIQVSGKEVGAMPRIESLTANNSTTPIEVQTNEQVTYTYIGRDADGVASRAIRIREQPFVINVKQLDWINTTRWSMSCWFKAEVFNHLEGTQIFHIRGKGDEWPASDWGFIWGSINADGSLGFYFRDAAKNTGYLIECPDYDFLVGQWYHFVCVADLPNRSCTIYVNGKKIGSTTVPSVYKWTNATNIMFGGPAFSRAGFDGYVDEFKIFDRLLTEAEAKESMEAQNPNTTPGLIGYWDFESEPDADQWLISSTPAYKGKKLKAFYGKFGEEAPDDPNTFKKMDMVEFGAGAPFLPGAIKKITTLPTWSLGAGVNVVSTGGDTNEGSAILSYPTEGVYSATVKLANDYGEASKTFQYVTITGTSIEEGVQEGGFNVFPNPFQNEVNLQFAESGAYTVTVYDVNGKAVSQQEFEVAVGQFICVAVNGAPGQYYVSVANQGKVVKTLKVIKQ